MTNLEKIIRLLNLTPKQFAITVEKWLESEADEMVDTEPSCCELCCYNDICPYNGKQVPFDVCWNMFNILSYPPEPLVKKVYTIRLQTDRTNVVGNREYRRKLKKQKGR